MRLNQREVIAALEHQLDQATERERDLSNQLAAANRHVTELAQFRAQDREMVTWAEGLWLQVQRLMATRPREKVQPSEFGNAGPPSGSWQE